MVLFKKKDDEEKKSEREKVEERREEVLARGRRFKYPLQYAKHKVVSLTIIISIFALAGISALVYHMLYNVKSTDDLLYRITQVLPLSVADVDGEKVRYSDYLLLYKSSITPIEKQGMVQNGQDISEMQKYYKREALTTAEDYTYALKLAREYNISVSNEEIDKAVENHRKAGGVERSEETFTRVLQDNFGLSLSEYRRIIYLSLISQKVSEKIDELAKIVSNETQGYLDEGKTLAEIAQLMGDKVTFEETDGLVDKMNIDGGRSTIALTLEKGKTSERFISTSGDGYYFVTLIDKTESTVNYKSLFIPFSELDTRLKKIRKEGKINERIELEETGNGEESEEQSEETEEN
jgi:hypothetical protein